MNCSYKDNLHDKTMRDSLTKSPPTTFSLLVFFVDVVRGKREGKNVKFYPFFIFFHPTWEDNNYFYYYLHGYVL